MVKAQMTIKQALAEIEELRTKLIKAEHTYRSLVEAMNEGALVLSPEGAIVYSNRTFAAMLGAPVCEVLGHPIYEFVADADVEPLRILLQQVPMRVGRKEINLKHTQSGSIPAFISVAYLETDEGPAVSAVVTDLTEAKRTEVELEQYREHLEDLVIERTKEVSQANEQLRVEIEARTSSEKMLRESEERFRAMADDTPLLIWVTDSTGQIRFINRAYVEFFGVNLDAVQSEGWQLLVHPDDDITYTKAYTDSLIQHKAFHGQARVRCRDGEWRWIESYAQPRFSPSDEFLGMAGSSVDITDRKQTEQIREELFEREHKIAEMLQQALLPSQIPYDLQGISIAARYQPALNEAYVGGDFYDVFRLGEHKLGVLIGDIAGKGLNAAIRVAEIRHAVRSYAFLGHNPGEVMALANEALLQEKEDMSHLLTAFFAVIDTSTGVMTYSCAGHEPPVVCNRFGDIDELDVTGMMLGVKRGAIFTEQIRELNVGDTVVMFTDGITEAKREGSILFDKQGVIQHLTKLCDAPPDEVANTLLEAATDHAGGHLQDDAAIVVLGFGDRK